MSDTLTLDAFRQMMAAVKSLPSVPSPLRIIENPHLAIGPFEDWSDVRSHGRAARRRRQGHPQRIRFYYKPDPNFLKLPDGSIVGHPETIAKLRQAAGERVQARQDRMFGNALFGLALA